jgi:hypothetical protein
VAAATAVDTDFFLCHSGWVEAACSSHKQPVVGFFTIDVLDRYSGGLGWLPTAVVNNRNMDELRVLAFQHGYDMVLEWDEVYEFFRLTCVSAPDPAPKKSLLCVDSYPNDVLGRAPQSQPGRQPERKKFQYTTTSHLCAYMWTNRNSEGQYT